MQPIEKSFEVKNIDNKIILTYCNLYHELNKKGLKIPDADLLIAATAITYNMSLKTKDKHFERLKESGLILER